VKHVNTHLKSALVQLSSATGILCTLHVKEEDDGATIHHQIRQELRTHVNILPRSSHFMHNLFHARLKYRATSALECPIRLKSTRVQEYKSTRVQKYKVRLIAITTKRTWGNTIPRDIFTCTKLIIYHWIFNTSKIVRLAIANNYIRPISRCDQTKQTCRLAHVFHVLDLILIHPITTPTHLNTSSLFATC
jgi:hypothetical protein